MLQGCYTFLGSIFSFTLYVSEAHLKHLKESMLFNEYPVLEDFFRDRKDEVKKMTHLDYTWEKREQMIRKEEFEDGVAEGMERGIERGVEKGSLQRLVNQVCSKLKRGKTPEEIADALEEPVENIRKICRIAEQYAPEYPVEEVCRALMD